MPARNQFPGFCRAEATDLPEFWLDLEIRGDATLGELDHSLRAI